MSIKSKEAFEHFAASIKALESPKSEPEKYHLYKGLMALCESIEDIETKINLIKHNIDNIT